MKTVKSKAAAGGTVGPSWWGMARRLIQADGLRWWGQWLMFFIATAAIVMRKPDLLLNPQFYAEGGAWYAEAYNLGWAHTLLMTGGGYLLVFPRLVEGLSLLVPLRLAPLWMNLCGILLQALPVTILLSSRCSRWGPLLVRLLMAAVYVALPNAGEIHVVLTNAQFHLGLVACLLVLAKPPTSWTWKVFDVAVLVLCGLTGPFCLILLPLAAVFWWARRQGWSGVVCGLLAVTSALQSLALLRGGWQERIQGPLGATPLLLAKILARHIYVGPLIGRYDFASRSSHPAIFVAALIGTSVLAWCFLKGGWELRLFIAFCAMLLAAGLRSPLISGSLPLWQLELPNAGCRYWFFPILAVAWSLIWCATQSAFKPCEILGVVCLANMLWSTVHHWKYPPFPNQQFPRYVNAFAAAPPGTPVTIPICPPECSSIRLIKRQ